VIVICASWRTAFDGCRPIASLTHGDVIITPVVDRLLRDTTGLLVIARDVQRAGAGLRSLAEPVVDTTSDFAELVLAMLGVAAKLEGRRITERTARGRRQSQGRRIRPQAHTHPTPAARGPRTHRRRRDATQRRPQLQRQSKHDFTINGMTTTKPEPPHTASQ
jgi:DNA invertase Pin-like site-specific DNA recombinase